MQRSKVRFIETRGNSVPICRSPSQGKRAWPHSAISTNPYSGAPVKIPLIKSTAIQFSANLLFLKLCEFFHQYILSHDHGTGVVQQ